MSNLSIARFDARTDCLPAFPRATASRVWHLSRAAGSHDIGLTDEPNRSRADKVSGSCPDTSGDGPDGQHPP